MPLLTRRSLRAALALGVAAGALLLTQAAGSTGKAGETCFGYAATIVGSPLPDTLNGTPGPDVIVAGAGNDKVFGFGGDDLICGGPGDDLLNAGPGNDRIDAGVDSNTIFGGLGNDEIIGPGWDDLIKYIDAPGPVYVDLAAGTATGEGYDTLSGIESIKGSRFGDTIIGNNGDNYLDGYEGNDTIKGQGGSDGLFFTGSGRVTIDAARGTATGQGNDTFSGFEAIIGSRQDDRIYGSAGSDFLIGNEGSDLVDGRGGSDVVAGDFDGDHGNDRLFGGPGNDILAGVAGDDLLNGGPGQQDIATYWYATGIRADLARKRVLGEGRDTLRGVEGVYGSPANDTLVGDRGANLLFGGEGGADKLLGKAGDDFLDGGAGRDSLAGGSGEDYCLEGEKRSSCEIGAGTLPVALAAPNRLRGASRLLQAADEDQLDYGENPTCTTRIVSALGPDGELRKRRRHTPAVTPPGRVVPAVHRRSSTLQSIPDLGPFLAAAAADSTTDVTWKPVLYRYNGRAWRRFKVFPELHTVVSPSTGFAAVWADAAGRLVPRVSLVVGSGRYAWTAVSKVGTGPATEATREPHLNYGGKGGRFQQACLF
ncbi:MAG: calcium-binding protein [Actinomycetota bacterium]|nr:calcium-binding protein [Actinomycetota bacterium]